VIKISEEKLEKFVFYDHIVRECEVDKRADIEPLTITVYGEFIQHTPLYVIVRSEINSGRDVDTDTFPLNRYWYIIRSAIIEPEKYKLKL